MSCNTVGLSFSGMSALGGMLGGGGLLNVSSLATNVMQSAGGGLIGSTLDAVSSVAGAAGGDLIGDLTNPLTELTSSVAGSFNNLGNIAEFGSGALTGAIGNSFGSIPGGNFINALNTHSGDLFGSGPIQMAQTFASAESFSAISADIAGPLTAGLTSNFGRSLAAINKTLPLNGDIGNFLGESIPDIQGALTNGLSTLTNSTDKLPNLASDLVNLGSSFDGSDIAHFGNPGQLINKISQTGGLEFTGITKALQDVGLGDIPIPQLVSSEYNDVVAEALSMISDPRAISQAQKLLGSNVLNIESLGDFADIKKLLPSSFDDIPAGSFDDLRDQLMGIELGSLQNIGDLGSLIDGVQTIDLSLLDGVTDVVDPTAISRISADFLGGTGTNGEYLIQDIMGTVAGVGITDNTNAHKAALDSIDADGGFDTLRTLYSELQSGMNGSYLDNPDPMIATKVTDPRTGIDYVDLDSFVAAKKSQITSELQSITDTYDEVGVAQSAWTAMNKKVFDERSAATKTDLGLSLRNEAKENAYYFVNSAKDRIANPDSEIMLEGMANAAAETGDRFGEYWKVFNAENKNRTEAEKHDIRWRNTEL